MKCSICNATFAESYYKNKYTNKIICDDCLLESDCMSYDTVTSYYLEGEYMGDTLISDFEKQFGVDVIVEYFDSNEMMYTKIQAGDAYDVLVPSDYMIHKLNWKDYALIFIQAVLLVLVILIGRG